MPFVKRENTLEAQDALTRLTKIGQRLTTLHQRVEAEQGLRDALVLEASLHGASRRDVAKAAHLTAGRVQQIVDST